MTTVKITTDQEVDWYKMYNVYALNLDTMLFENVSYLYGDVTINVIDKDHEDDEEELVQDMLETLLHKKTDKGADIWFALYSESHFLVGYVEYKK